MRSRDVLPIGLLRRVRRFGRQRSHRHTSPSSKFSSEIFRKCQDLSQGLRGHPVTEETDPCRRG